MSGLAAGTYIIGSSGSAVNLAGNTLTVNALSAQTVTFSAKLGNAQLPGGGLTVSGGGAVLFDNTNSEYAPGLDLGALIINDGSTVSLPASVTFGAVSNVSGVSSSSISLTNGSTLVLGNSAKIGSFGGGIAVAIAIPDNDTGVIQLAGGGATASMTPTFSNPSQSDTLKIDTNGGTLNVYGNNAAGSQGNAFTLDVKDTAVTPGTLNLYGSQSATTGGNDYSSTNVTVESGTLNLQLDSGDQSLSNITMTGGTITGSAYAGDVTMSDTSQMVATNIQMGSLTLSDSSKVSGLVATSGDFTWRGSAIFSPSMSVTMVGGNMDAGRANNSSGTPHYVVSYDGTNVSKITAGAVDASAVEVDLLLAAGTYSPRTHSPTIVSAGSLDAAPAALPQWNIAGVFLDAGHTIPATGGEIALSLTHSSTDLNLGLTVNQTLYVTTPTTTNYVVPTTPPTTTIATAAFSADTGTSATDFITSTAAQTISGTLSANLVTGELVQVSLNNGTTWATATTSVSANTWSLAGQTLTGSNTLKVRVANTGSAGTIFSQAYVLDTTAPTVASVGVPANTTYVAGQNLDFTVNWNENVTVTGTPRLALTIGSTVVNASYLSGSGTSALVFRYTVQAGDLDTDGIAVGALSLNSGTIKDTAGNNATLPLNSVGATASVRVDAVAPTVSSATVPVSATYAATQNLNFTVTYAENVVVTTSGGTPYVGVTLDTGGTVHAAYLSGSGTTTLTFRYTVVTGNADATGVAVASSITLNGGTIQDAAGNAATTSVTFGSTTSVLVDAIVPAVSSINRQTPAGPSTNAATTTYRATFSKSVTGVDATDFTLTATGTAAGTVASVTTVSASVYDVTVNTVSGNGTLRLDLNASGTGITDTPGNPIAAGFTAGQAYTIDNIAPTLSTILRLTPATVNTSAASATYEVTFSEGVTGVDATDFALTAVSGAPSGTIGTVTPVSTSVYDVVVNSLAGQGQLRLDLKASSTGIADLAGNAIAAGGFTTGDFYLVGVTNVFDSVSLATGTTRSVSGASTNQVAQRFTTAASAPLTVTKVAAALGTVTGTPTPVVTIHADNAGAPGVAVIATLTNPASLTANALNVWTGNTLLTASTTYWVVFADTSVAGAYAIKETAATTGGVGAWLTNPDYAYFYGANAATGPQAGTLRLGIGATSPPTITGTLTAAGTCGTAFGGYTITGTNLPTSFGATGLPTGLTLTPATGVIAGTPTQAGVFNVTLTGTNVSGTGLPSTLVLTIAKAPLTATANNQSRAYGGANPTLTVSYAGLVNGDTAAALTTAPIASTGATAGSQVGSYSIAVGGGVSANYTFTYVNGTLSIGVAQQTITFASPSATTLGQTVTLSAAANSGFPVTFSVVSGSATISGATVTPTGVGSVTVRASQAGNVSYFAPAPNVDRSFTVGSALSPTPVPAPASGSTATLTVPGSNPNIAYQWQRDGANLTGATGPSLILTNVQPSTAGLYSYTASLPGSGGGTSDPVIVGISTTSKVIGSGADVGENIVHPNGNTYDQVLLQGPAATVTADVSQVTRISFVDLSNDIVQVEFSGAGTLSVTMDGASSPSPASNYNQPGVAYVKGHAGLIITGANETSNLSIFTVGPITAVNQGLFVSGVKYDGVADIAFVAIQSTNGKFGGIRSADADYFATTGFTGIYAPGVQFTGPVYVNDINASAAATPVLMLGSASDTRITGGNLLQPNGQPVKVSGITQLKFVNGTTSEGVVLPAQANKGVLQQNGVDVTAQIVVSP